MDKQYSVNSSTLCDIIQQKLTGIINKIEIVAETEADKQLVQRLVKILETQQSVSELIEKMKANP